MRIELSNFRNDRTITEIAMPSASLQMLSVVRLHRTQAMLDNISKFDSRDADVLVINRMLCCFVTGSTRLLSPV
jgi:hypothetical protein